MTAMAADQGGQQPFEFALLIGGGTLRAEDPPLIIRDPAVRDRRAAAKGSPHPRNITVCSVLPENLAGMDFFRSPVTEKLVFTTERTTPALREALKSDAAVYQARRRKRADLADQWLAEIPAGFRLDDPAAEAERSRARRQQAKHQAAESGLAAT